MPRIRTIKPDFFTSDDILDLSPLARLLYIALWCYADREGRYKYSPRAIAAQCMPGEYAEFENTYKELEDQGLVLNYIVNGKVNGCVPTFNTHQRPNNTEKDSALPDPSGEMTIRGAYPTESRRKEIYRRDNHTCAYCAINMKEATRKRCLDHVIPFCAGGTNNTQNLVTACKKCNAKKADRNPYEAGMPWPEGLGESILEIGTIDLEVFTVNTTVNGSGQTVNRVLTKEKEKEKEKEGEKEEVSMSGKPDEKPDARLNNAAQTKLIGEIIKHLNAKTGKGFRNVDSNSKLIRARLKEGFTHEDLLAVIDRKCEQWLHDDKMFEFLRPSTLFNKEKFSQYHGELPARLRKPATGKQEALERQNDTVGMNWADQGEEKIINA